MEYHQLLYSGFLPKKISPVKIGPNNSSFREQGGLNVKFLFPNPKKHPCEEPRRLTYFA